MFFEYSEIFQVFSLKSRVNKKNFLVSNKIFLNNFLSERKRKYLQETRRAAEKSQQNSKKH